MATATANENCVNDYFNLIKAKLNSGTFFHLIPFPYFWLVDIKIFISWSDNDYASVLVESTEENLFFPLNTINHMLKQSFTEYIAWIDHSNFNLKV